MHGVAIVTDPLMESTQIAFRRRLLVARSAYFAEVGQTLACQPLLGLDVSIFCRRRSDGGMLSGYRLVSRKCQYLRMSVRKFCSLKYLIFVKTSTLVVVDQFTPMYLFMPTLNFLEDLYFVMKKMFTTS